MLGPGQGRLCPAGRAPWEEPTPGNPGAAPALTWGNHCAGLPGLPCWGAAPGGHRSFPILPASSSASPQLCSVHQPPLHSLSAQENQQLFHYSSFPHSPLKCPTQGLLPSMPGPGIGQGKALPGVWGTAVLLYLCDSYSWDKRSLGSSTVTCCLHQALLCFRDGPEHQRMQATQLSLVPLVRACGRRFAQATALRNVRKAVSQLSVRK